MVAGRRWLDGPLAALAVAFVVVSTQTYVCEGADRSGPYLLKLIADSPTDVKLRWDLDPGEVLALAEALIANQTMVYDAVAASVSRPSWDATMQPMVDADAVAMLISSTCTFPSQVAASKALRDASTSAQSRLSTFAINTAARLDVYQALLAFNATPEAVLLRGERARYAHFLLRGAMRSGLGLPKAQRDEVLALQQQIANLETEFTRCLGEDTSYRSFTRAELKGLPASYLDRLSPDPASPGKLVVTVQYPDYFPLMDNCQVEATRRTMNIAFTSVCKDNNTRTLDALVKLRAQVASLLGYPSYAAYVQQINMAKEPSKVTAFLNDLSARLEPLAAAERAEMLGYKQLDVVAQRAAQGAVFVQETPKPRPGDAGAAGVQLAEWDLRFYQTRIEKNRYSVGQQKVQEYFPLEHVTQRMLGIYADMLGLRFQLDQELSSAAWHPDVQAYKVYDKASERLIGVFYLDLHPRPGKYSHAAMFPLQPAVLAPNQRGKRWLSVGALVVNFAKSSPTVPSLLPHDDVVTYFHEFGHVMHKMCAMANLTLFEGTNVEQDFVEAPSQMLENWVFHYDVLQRLSGHYTNTSQPLPKALAVAISKSRAANAGMMNKRQIAYASFDQAIHNQLAANTSQVYASTLASITGVPTAPGTNGAARFGHMASGYGAQYYGYLWSEVFSADMFYSRFLREGIFNPKTGMSYRTSILQPGGSKDAWDLLRSFLGRDPNNRAFLQDLGLNPDMVSTTDSRSQRTQRINTRANTVRHLLRRSAMLEHRRPHRSRTA